MSSFTENIILSNRNYIVVGLSKQGKYKEENQDSFKFYHDENCIIGVVADGLGSALKSAQGSALACRVAIDELKGKNDYEGISTNILHNWLSKISGKPLAFDTTLRFVKITKDSIILGGVGDGWTVGFIDDHFISIEAKNKFANQTNSLMSYEISKYFFVKQIPFKSECIISISTDGFSEEINKTVSKDFMKTISKEMQENSEQFICNMEETLNNWPIESNHDDKTAIFIQRRRTK